MMIILLLFFCVSAASAHVAKPSNYSDQHALMAFKASLLLDPYNSLLHWSPNHSTCNWTGVICSSRRQRVVSLNLTHMGLYGPISPFLGNLSFLRVLALYNNSLEGHVPYELGRLFRLRKLLLSNNNLEGPIPPSLSGCRSLQSLILSANNFSGSIPSDFSLLSNLETMGLGRNQLTGIIPPFLRNLSSLKTLDLPENRFEGGIPWELGMLSQLNWLNLASNKLTGLIPVTLSNCNQLRKLFIGPNKLTGSIPIALSNCTHLQLLQLYQNHLTGPIPWELGRLSELKEVYLWENQLSGEIPSSVGNWTQLQRLDLSKNQLSGRVPLEFGKLQQLRGLVLWRNNFVSGSNGLSILTVLINCSGLKYLDLGFNYLTGSLPTSVGRLSSSLSILSLNSNEIGGNIPEEIGNLSKLATISIEVNRFNGTIPSSFSKLPNLERLLLNTNNLQGRILESFGQSKKLGLLALSKNMLSGEIPDSLGDLPQLRQLYLDHNQLSGKIPASLGRCKTLELMDLAHNKLRGNIPPEVVGLQNLQLYFNVSGNLLEGSVLEVSKMVMVSAIDVSQNNFSGSIPGALESCKGLEYLNLSMNRFEGPIPASLADLQNLQSMDLSCNNLTGTIPMALKNMKMLKHLNLSSNRLTGEVSKGGAFSTLDSSEIMGNLGLCGGWINLPPCSYSKKKHLLVSKKVIIPVVIGIAILIMSLILVAFIYRSRHSSTPILDVWPPNVSYEELVNATNGFSDENLLGSGSFGLVYKGILKNDTNIVVKVLKLQVENAHQSFIKECNALKRVRHRNVIKIISVCSNLDFKALILPFMSNGSLGRWLYPCEGGECILNLSDRIRIALEIAQGLAYLHHYCFVQVIHCDLKPNNILLGDDMTSYIADFGISNIIFDNSMDSVTSTNALKGSIGYIPPEYGIGTNLSTKGDVYSYGVLLLELLTRRRPTDEIFTVKGITLPKWIEMHFPNAIVDVIDNSLLIDAYGLGESTIMKFLSQFIQIGLFCTRDSPHERPDMSVIVDRLNTISSAFFGTPKTLQLPIDITPFIKGDKSKSTTEEGNRGSWSTSTS